jgi:predicted dehydrogenase
MILEALSAGKHVACEKPLTSSLALVDRIAEAEAHGTARLMPILQYRFGPGFERVRAVVRSGLLGRLYVASAETARRRGPDYYQVPWRGRFATELGGVFVTQAIHIHDLLLELTGPAEAVSAFAATRVNPIEVEDCGVASLRLSGGALASLTATLGAMRQMTRIRLCWERATIECHALDAFAPRPAEADWAVVPADPEVGRTLAAAMADVEVGPAGFVGQYAAFHTALVSGGPLPVTLADARSALELVTALYHSSRTETLVTLPIGRDHPLYDGWGPG